MRVCAHSCVGVCMSVYKCVCGVRGAAPVCVCMECLVSMGVCCTQGTCEHVRALCMVYIVMYTYLWVFTRVHDIYTCVLYTHDVYSRVCYVHVLSVCRVWYAHGVCACVSVCVNVCVSGVNVLCAYAHVYFSLRMHVCVCGVHVCACVHAMCTRLMYRSPSVCGACAALCCDHVPCPVLTSFLEPYLAHSSLPQGKTLLTCVQGASLCLQRVAQGHTEQREQWRSARPQLGPACWGSIDWFDVWLSGLCPGGLSNYKVWIGWV